CFCLQAEDGIRDRNVTGVQTCALPISTIPPVLGWAVVLAVVTTLTKIITGVVAARKSGVARMGQLRAGTVLVARGEFSIVIAGKLGRASCRASGHAPGVPAPGTRRAQH